MHLSDAEIDAYWKGTLTADEEERLEQHYLDCNDCAARVRVVEDLTGLRPQPGETPSGVIVYGRQRVGWALGAAAVLVIGVLAGWQAGGARRAAVETAPPAAIPAGSTTLARLVPPTRDSSPQTVTVPVSGVVVFELDAREAGAGGTRFDVTLADAAGRTMLQVSGVLSTADALVRVPVDAALLAPAQYIFELHVGPTVVGFPFLLRR
jgi:hypothetical protein